MSLSAPCPNCGESVTVTSMHFFDPTLTAVPLPLTCGACGVMSSFVASAAGVDEDGPKDERLENGTATFRRLG